MVLTENKAPKKRPRRKPSNKAHNIPQPMVKKPGLACRMAASLLLTRVIDDQRSLDGLLDTKHGPQIWHKLETADKNLARAIITTALRHRGEIEFHLAKCLDRKLPKMPDIWCIPYTLRRHRYCS